MIGQERACNLFEQNTCSDQQHATVKLYATNDDQQHETAYMLQFRVMKTKAIHAAKPEKQKRNYENEKLYLMSFGFPAIIL